MKKFRYGISLACFLVATMANMANADLLADGRGLYKVGKYAEAATKLEAAAKESPKDARIFWQLNFTYHKLNRESDSLAAVKKAGELDPAHTFASEKGKYESILIDRERQAGASVTTGTKSTGQMAGQNVAVRLNQTDASAGGITKRLLDGNVYAEPGIEVDVQKLESVSQSLKPTIVKFAIFARDANSSALSAEAHKIRDYLSIGNGYVIASSRRGVVVSSTQLTKDQERTLIKKVAPVMETGRYTDGLETLARSLVQTHDAGVKGSQTLWVVILGGLGGFAVIFFVAKSIKKNRLMAERRQPLERMKSDVIKQMSVLDDNIVLADAATAARMKDARLSAGTRLDEATRILRNASTEGDLNRAESLLQSALGDLRNGRAILDRHLNPPDPSTAANSAPILGAATMGNGGGATMDWNAVPQNEKAVCFFCSQPSRMAELTPVTVNLGGQQQKVLACMSDLQTIKTGQMPSIRAFQQDGQYVPWYASQNYDPYRDYYSRGYNNRSLVSDLITLSVIDSMFWGWHRPMGWGWGGGGYGYGGNSYCFYPDHDGYRDYYSHGAAGYGDYNSGPSDSAGVDFMGSTGGDSYGSGNMGGDFGGSGGNFGGGSDRS